MNHLSVFRGSPAEITSTLRDDYMNRIFEVLGAAFGTHFTNKWAGSTPELMKQVWGRKLARYSDQGEAIAGALNEAIECEFPPNLGQFYLMCQKRYQQPTYHNTQPALEDHRTDEDKAFSGEEARKTVDEYLKSKREERPDLAADYLMKFKKMLTGMDS